MAERSGFFDAHLVNGEYDRVYLAESFAKYFASFIGNGVFGGKSNELMVQQKETADMSVNVLSGLGYINGYFYENDDELSLAVDTADGVLNRIDLIVLRWNKSERVIRLAIKKGTPASSPSTPALIRNDDFYELGLAKIQVKAGTVRITQSDIVDTRLDSDVCGFVVGVVQQFDTSAFGVQLNSYIVNFVAEYGAWLVDFQNDANASIAELVDELNAILDDISLVELTRRVAELEASKFAESEEHPGCYYVLANGVVEWLNPPNEPGIEYRLLERFEEKPVYQMMVYVASLANNSFMNIGLETTISKVVSVTGVVHNESIYSSTHPFPVFMEGSTTPSAVIQNVGESTLGHGISIRTVGDMRGYTANITVKYTKT